MSLVKAESVIASPKFKRKAKKLNANDKKYLDEQIKILMKAPETGTLKSGDLSHIRVHYFKFPKSREITLLAYIYNEGLITLMLLDYGTHENFYRELKRHPDV